MESIKTRPTAPAFGSDRISIVVSFSLFRGIFALLCALVFTVNGAQAEESIVWHARQSLLDAKIENSTLQKTLQKLATATGWIVYMEPDAEFTVSCQFKGRNVADALGKLFGTLNYAILPQKNGSSKLFVFRSSIGEATQQIVATNSDNGANSEDRIRNEWVVVMKKGAKTSIDDLAKKYGAKVVGRAPGLNAYRLQWDDADAASAAKSGLQSESDVEMVDANQSVSAPTRIDPLSISSSLPLSIRANPNPDPNRLVIGLIDTAIQPQTSTIKDFLLPGISVAGQNPAPSDGPTHATSMAETILRGMSLTGAQAGDGTTTRILPINVYGSGESTTTFDVANGISVAIQNNATLINLSLGSSGDSALLHQVITQAHNQGVVFVAAAGNEPTTAATYPAAYSEVLATTAGDKKGAIASYANRGNFVDVMAPGSSIVAFDNQSYLVSGTSAATAYITGATASAASSAGKPVSQIESQVRKNYAYNP